MRHDAERWKFLKAASQYNCKYTIRSSLRKVRVPASSLLGMTWVSRDVVEIGAHQLAGGGGYVALQRKRLGLSVAGDHVQDVLLYGCAEVWQRQHLKWLLYLNPDVFHLHSRAATYFGQENSIV